MESVLESVKKKLERDSLTVNSYLFVVYQFSWISWIVSDHEIKNSMNICSHIYIYISEFLKFVGPIEPRGQKIMRSANNVSNAGPHVRQTFLNDVFTFLTEVGNGRALLQIEKKGRVSLGQGRALHPAKTG